MIKNLQKTRNIRESHQLDEDYLQKNQQLTSYLMIRNSKLSH